MARSMPLRSRIVRGRNEMRVDRSDWDERQLESLKHEIAERLRSVCELVPADDFDRLVDRIARVQRKYEQQSVRELLFSDASSAPGPSGTSSDWPPLTDEMERPVDDREREDKRLDERVTRDAEQRASPTDDENERAQVDDWVSARAEDKYGEVF